MSDSPIDEVIIELNKVDLRKSEVSDAIDYKKILEKTCCEELKRYQCRTHFLTTDLKNTLVDNLNSLGAGKKANAANLIAELGKHEECKDFILDSDFVKALISNLKSSNIDVLIQTCRAMANICYEKVEGQNLFVKENGITPAISILEKSLVPSSVENQQTLKLAAIGLLLNLIADNDAIQKQVFNEKLLETLTGLIKADLRNHKPTALSQNVFIVLVVLTEAIPVVSIFTQDICDLAVEVFRNSYHDDFCVTGLEFLEDADVPDTVKLNLAKSGIFQLFVSFLESKPKNPTESESNRYDLTGRVLANILTGDEAMEYLYDCNNGEIMTHLTKWLTMDDKEMVYTGVACIGNIARTDKHSIDIVEKDIHKLLLNILKDESSDIKLQYAVLSTIRNLSIPKVNKVKMVQDSLIETFLPMLNLDLKTSSPVIFKLVGTFRQVIDGQEKLAIELGCNEKLVGRLVTWSSSTICPWVSSECCRLLCGLVKISKDRNVMLNILRSGGYDQILKTLGALHGLMQSEAVSALTITSVLVLLEKEKCLKTDQGNISPEPVKVEEKTNTEGAAVNTLKKDGNYEIKLGDNICHSEAVSQVEERFRNLKLTDYDEVLLNGELGEKLSHLISQHGAKMDEHILENIFTFLEIVIKFEKVRENFRNINLKNVFQRTMQARDDFARFKTRIEGIEKSF